MKALEGLKRYERNARARYQTVFEGLANAQTPHTMVIGCVDSRVDPNLLFGAEPGELFTLRNVAAIVPRASSGDTSVRAAIAYAVEVLGIRDLVICGHANCGGVTALLAGGANDASIDAWLANASMSLAAFRMQGGFDASLPEVDQLSQFCAVEHARVVAEMEPVAARAARGEVRVHAAWFDIKQARTLVFDAVAGRFLPVGSEFDVAAE